MEGAVTSDEKRQNVAADESTSVDDDVDIDAAFDSIVNVESIHHLKGFVQVIFISQICQSNYLTYSIAKLTNYLIRS